MLATIVSIAAVTATVATALFVWKQAGLLRIQNQLQALIQLNSAWDSTRMRFLRSSWAEDELRDRLTDDDRDLDTLEPLLEFLEEFASLRRQKILDDELVWDSTIGWHAARYYFYNFDNNNVGRLRSNWMDGTFYQNLEMLWQGYLKIEANERGIDEKELIKQIRETKPNFLKAERNVHRIPESSD
jgi:hypothetical protein